MIISDSIARHFFDVMAERHRVYERRAAGQPWPWTEDRILQEGRFCNVYRELDKTTAWFREHIREPLRDRPEVLLATVAFRWFNRIETWQSLFQHRYGCSMDLPSSLVSLFGRWEGERVHRQMRAACTQPWVTGAYIIKTPDGMDKLTGVLWCIDQIAPWCGDIIEKIKKYQTLEAMWRYLREYPYLGDFMAYEVVTDLRHTHLLSDAKDIMSWANPGPGAARGFSRICDADPGTLNRSSERDRAILIGGMQQLLEMSRELWPGHWPAWEMREVEHCLCEYDKYQRVFTGEGRMKQKYRRPR